MESSFVVVDGLSGTIDYGDVRRAVGHKSTVSFPRGKGFVAVSVCFPRREMTVAEAVTLGQRKNMRLAFLPETIAAIDHRDPRIKELLRASRVAGHQRKKHNSFDCFALACARLRPDSQMPFRHFILREGSFWSRVDFRDIDHVKMSIPVTMGIPFVYQNQQHELATA